MKYPKEWKCNNCGKPQDKHDVIRIKKELFGYGRYDQFYKEFAIDLCKECYTKLLRDILECKLERNEEYYYD